jgi:hypothetical protein
MSKLGLWFGALAVSFAALMDGDLPTAEAAKCPNVHIVVDRSGSMTSTIPGGKSRWETAKDAVKALLGQYDGKFPIGMSIFPAAGCDSQLVSEPAYRTKAKIEMALNAQGPDGLTPSASAMRDALALKSLRDPDREQYVVLITDGGPGCSGGIDTCPGTVNQIDVGAKANPPVFTFVVGFGGGLDTTAKQCMTQMATAGGKPAPTTDKYYKADNAAELNLALSEIVKVIGGGGDVGMSGFCDDTCYSNGCKTPGDICVAGECRANPCSGVSCPKDQYCYTDGFSGGICVRGCTKACPAGTRCLMGSCANDPCAIACPAGTICDSTVKNCVRDPLCGMMAPEDACRGTSACRAGKCIDDPCRFLTCPKGTRCVPWEGTCNWVPPPPDETMMPDPMMPDDNDPTGGRMRGCNTVPGHAANASLLGGLLFLLGMVLARRRLVRL